MKPPESPEEWTALFALNHPPLVEPFREPRVVRGDDKSKRGRPICIHHAILVDSQTRSLACRKCDANIDPIDYLAKLANEGSWIVHLHEQKLALGEEVERLKHEVTLLKAQKKRASDDAVGILKRVVKEPKGGGIVG
jgi:hypothetical protein